MSIIIDDMARALTQHCYQPHGTWPSCKADQPCGDCEARAEAAAAVVAKRLRELIHGENGNCIETNMDKLLAELEGK